VDDGHLSSLIANICCVGLLTFVRYTDLKVTQCSAVLLTMNIPKYHGMNSLHEKIMQGGMNSEMEENLGKFKRDSFGRFTRILRTFISTHG